MKCPVCLQPTKIFDSRMKGPRKWRRHACPNGHKFTTWEILESEIGTPAWISETELSQRVIKAVAKLLPQFVDELVAEISRME